MTRMGKEFSLVLLGAGILTAGSFLWPENDAEAHAGQAAAQQVAGHTRHRTGYHPGLIFIHTSRGIGSPTASSARAGISRSGFGSIGRSVSVSS